MTTNKPTKLVVTQAQREAALEGRVHDCPYNHQIGTRCPNCASWPFKKGGAAAFIEQVRENHRLASTAPASGDEVERVARALYECERNRSERTDVIISASAGKTVSVGMEPWEECWQVFHDDARAAIAALRPASDMAWDEVDRFDLSDHFPTGLRQKYPGRISTGEVFEYPYTCECYCGETFSGPDEQEVRQLWALHIAALRPRSEREEVVRETLEEAAKVAESFPFSDSVAIAHRTRALIDKEPAEIARLRSALHLIASQKHLDPIWTTFARKMLEEPSQ